MTRRDRSRTGLAALALAGAAAMALGSCGDDAEAGNEGQRPDTAGDSYARVVNVEVDPVEPRSFTEQIRLSGTVEALQDVTVAAEESGRIRTLYVEKGTGVDEGDPIVKIDDAILSAQVEEARARARLAGKIWERRRRLWEEERIGTEQAYLEARAEAEQAAASLEVLRERLARTTVRAPFSGVLDERTVERGQMVSAGTPVARVVQLDTVTVTAGVPERFAPDVRPGSAARVTFDVLPGRIFEGSITYVGSTVNPSNRTFPVEFTLPNPDGVVKPEMVARVVLARRTLENVLVVPQEALVRTEAGFRAFVAEAAPGGRDADGTAVARARNLEVGPAQRNRVVVEEGLQAGDRLIVVGQNQVADGDRIRIVGNSGAGGEVR